MRGLGALLALWSGFAFVVEGLGALVLLRLRAWELRGLQGLFFFGWGGGGLGLPSGLRV